MKEQRPNIILLLLVCSFSLDLNTSNSEDLNKLSPPKPEKIPVTFEAHGTERLDNYYWMRDDTRKNPKVINHLKAENAYLENWFKSGADARDKLFE